MRVQLSQHGPEFSRIVAGVWKWGAWGHKLTIAEQADLIGHCIRAGVTTFDHADIYGGHTAEEEFGKAFQQSGFRREEIQIVTKCGIKLPSNRRPYATKTYATSYDHIIWSVDQSLKNLRTDYLDLLLIHRPSPLMDPDVMAEAFEDLKQQGKVRDFGVSNFTVSQFEMVNARIRLVTNQIECSLLHRTPFLDGTLDLCLQHKIRPMAWSPLGGGALFTGRGERVNAIRNTAEMLCARYGAESVDQIYLAWLFKHPAGILPVLGTARPERMKSAVKAFAIALSDEDWFVLWTAATGEEIP